MPRSDGEHALPRLSLDSGLLLRAGGLRSIDEVSAVYSDFGKFCIGLQLPLDARFRWLQLGALRQEDGWQSGLMRTPGKRVCRKATRVRIPAHPPHVLKGVFLRSFETRSLAYACSKPNADNGLAVG